MILITAVNGRAIAEFCGRQPELPQCVAHAAHMAAIEPWLTGALALEVSVFAAYVIWHRIKTGKWSPS